MEIGLAIQMSSMALAVFPEKVILTFTFDFHQKGFADTYIRTAELKKPHTKTNLKFSKCLCNVIYKSMFVTVILVPLYLDRPPTDRVFLTFQLFMIMLS